VTLKKKFLLKKKKMLRRTFFRRCAPPVERMVEEYDVVVVGGGPSGLATAIKLKQLTQKWGDSFRVCLVEKGNAIGAHILSGACIEPRALAELFPDWKEKGAPLNTPVHSDSFHLLTSSTSSIKVPEFMLPPSISNHGNYIVSLGAVCEWLGERAAELGIDIFPGFAGSAPVFEDGKLVGVQLNDCGISKKGEQTDAYQPGMILKGKQTVIAEGSRGSLTKMLETKYDLRRSGAIFQTYGLGCKEVWEIPKERHEPGKIVHTAGWPLTKSENHDKTYGGSFLYHYGENLVSLGFVVGLDYKNPYTRPYMELQKWKTHPLIQKELADGKPIWYGARTLVEGGITSLPKLTFPGGMLVGDCAGFLNMPKIKGTHTAMKSGLLAAESIIEQFYGGVKADEPKAPGYGSECTKYPENFKKSWLYEELNAVRNCRQAFESGLYFGMAYTGLATMFFKGKEPWTWRHHKPDNECLLPASACKEIEYPKPDGKLTFDLLTNHSRSGTNHNADQPVHLKLRRPAIATETNWKLYAGPEGRYCPAQVYVFDDKGNLTINAQNCLHCKACDIKDPTQNIDWATPEGNGGPSYNAQM
jgi:electron-transferring-flavoprotein dehydrogenase